MLASMAKKGKKKLKSAEPLIYFWCTYIAAVAKMKVGLAIYSLTGREDLSYLAHELAKMNVAKKSTKVKLSRQLLRSDCLYSWVHCRRGGHLPR